MNDPSTAAVPPHVPADRIIHFDYLRDPALPADPYGRFKQVQDSTPHEVVWTTGNGGHWMILRADAVVDALQKTEWFSSIHIQIPPPPPGAWRRLIPEELDPPEHEKYRSLLSSHFGPRTMKRFDARAKELAKQLFDRIAHTGRADLMRAVTIPLPCSIFLDMVGLPNDRLEEFVALKDQLFTSNDPVQMQAATIRIYEICSQCIETLRKTPGENLLSHLLSPASQVDGRPLTHEELLSIAFMMFIAGLDTVTSAMTSCLAYLVQNPAQRQRLVDDPARIPEAIEEVLRRHSVVNMIRTASCDFEWRGLSIRKGDQFVASSVMANLDEREFPAPMQVNLDREVNRHILFGVGPHRCVGSHLARVELRAVMHELLPRLKNVRLQPGTQLRWTPPPLFGLTSLPVEWDVA